MSTVGTQYSSLYNNSATGTTNNTSQSSQSSSNSNSLDNTSAFLQLLVAQLQNQDPMQPTDPTTFVTQLAEFNDVEQNMATRTDVDAISEKYLGTTTPPSASLDSTTGSTSSSSSSSSNTNSTSETQNS
jgi:flagellar basal-body rod modification protein FlgD